MDVKQHFNNMGGGLGGEDKISDTVGRGESLVKYLFLSASVILSLMKMFKSVVILVYMHV